MVDIKEVISDITTLNGAGKVAVMYFGPEGTAEEAADATTALWDAIKSYLSPGFRVQVRSTGKVLDSITGDLQGVWTSTGQGAILGGAPSEPVADATQVLLRWKSDAIVNNRFVQGRTYVPMLAQIAVDGGNLSTEGQTLFNGAASTFAGLGKGFGIWTRPFPGTEEDPIPRPGAFSTATQGSVWTELAVQRRRRG